MKIEFTPNEKVKIAAEYSQYLSERIDRGDEPTEKELQLLFIGTREVLDDLDTILRRWGPVLVEVAKELNPLFAGLKRDLNSDTDRDSTSDYTKKTK